MKKEICDTFIIGMQKIFSENYGIDFKEDNNFEPRLWSV